MNDSDCPFVQLFLVKILILDHIDVDKISQIGACIPSSVIRIHIDLSQLFDHLRLVRRIRFSSRSSSGQI